MKKILHYITYQTFPADTANSLQTISNLKYFVKNNYEVNLYFPLREKNSSKELENIQKKYNFNEIINVFASSHPCLLYTSPSPRDRSSSRMPSSA